MHFRKMNRSCVESGFIVWLLCSNPQSHFLLLYRILLVRDRGGADCLFLTHFVTLGESWPLCRKLLMDPQPHGYGLPGLCSLPGKPPPSHATEMSPWCCEAAEVLQLHRAWFSCCDFPRRGMQFRAHIHRTKFLPLPLAPIPLVKNTSGSALFGSPGLSTIVSTHRFSVSVQLL